MSRTKRAEPIEARYQRLRGLTSDLLALLFEASVSNAPMTPEQIGQRTDEILLAGRLAHQGPDTLEEAAADAEL